MSEDERRGRRETLRRLLLSQAEPERGRSKVLRDAVLYLVVATSIVFALRLLPENAWVATQRDRVMDWMVEIHAGTEPEDYDAPPLVFVDLDEALYRAWGEPARIPAAPLAQLLEALARTRPALVILDVDLGGDAPAGGEQLERTLAALGKGPVPVLMARSYRVPLDEAATLLEERPSFLDPLVARSPALHWASTRFARDRDWVIRRYHTFEATCSDGEGAVLPAIHVLAVAQIEAGSRGVERLDRALVPHVPRCREDPGEPAPDTEVRFGEVEVAFSSSPVANRILYGVRAPGPGRPFASARVPFGEREVPVFTRVPASLLLDPKRPPAPGLLEGRIAVVGASYAASRDVHRTPVGEMAGAVILMNSTYSLLQFGGLRTPGGGVVVATQIAVLAVLSLLFARLPLYWSLSLGPAVIALGLVPFSLWLFRHGLWLDFAIPLLMLQVLTLLKKHGDRIAHMREQLGQMRRERKK